MRVVLCLAACLPFAATAQVDVTPTAKSAVRVIELLQRHVGPQQQAWEPVEWCVADAYRLAAPSADGAVARVMRRAAEAYDASGAMRVARMGGGIPLTPGTEIVVRVSDRFVCRTTVRDPGLIRG